MQITLSRRTNYIEGIYAILLVFTPILDQYEFPFLSFFELFTVFSMLLYLFRGYRFLTIRNHWMTYYCYVAFITLLFSMTLGDFFSINIILRLMKLFLLLFNIFVIAPALLKWEFVIDLYEAIVVTAAVVLIFQYAVYFLLKTPTMLLIPGLTLNYNGGIESSTFMELTIGRIYTGYYYRPCSFFIEPSFQVQYSLPLLAVLLNRLGANFKAKKLIVPLVISMAMILTTSFLGIVCVLFLWVIELFRMIRSCKRKIIKRLVWILPIIAAGAVFLLTRDFVNLSIVSKLNQIANHGSSSSFTLRILRGWECFKQPGPFVKLFGCGYGNLSDYYAKINLHTIYDGTIKDVAYMNGLFTILCSLGIIGFLLYMLALLPLLRHPSPLMRMLLVCFGLLMLSSACFDTANYCVLLCMMFTLVNKKSEDSTELC